MLSFYQLLKTGLLTPASLLSLYKAKRKHKNNLCFILKFAAQQYGNKTAITDGHRSYNFNELYEAVLQVSFTIDSKLVIPKQAAAILICDNTIDHILVFYAIQNLGIKLILVNNKAHRNDLSKIINSQAQPCYIFSTGPPDSLWKNTADINELVRESLKEKRGEKFSTHFAKLFFPTSGTTGEPKLIEKRTGEMYWLQSFADLLIKTNIHKTKSVFITIPISQGFGYTAILFALVLGKKALITAARDRQYITTTVIKEQTDLVVGVPSSLYWLSEILEGTQHPIRTVVSGGAPLNEIILKKIIGVFGKQIFSIYGSTEASVSFIANYDHLVKDCNTIGLPLNTVKYRLLDLPAGGHELLLQSGLSNISTGSGWVHTGDLAEKDSNGVLKWCGRKDNMIIKNGVNIYPQEIENQLLRIACIEDVYVSGQKDIQKGELIVAVIKIKTGFAFNEEKIKEALRQVLPGIKIPDTIYEAENFEYTATGKKVNQSIISRYNL